MQAPGARLDSVRWMFGRLLDHTARMFEPIARASEGADLDRRRRRAARDVVDRRVARRARTPRSRSVRARCRRARRRRRRCGSQTLPQWVNRLLWQVGAPVADLALRGTINRGRAALGLGSIVSTLSHIADRRVIIAADRDLAPLADDGPASVVGTDALIFDAGVAIDPRLDAFLNLDPAPIYVGFGSMIASRTADLAEQAIAAARAVGRGAILSGGWAGARSPRGRGRRPPHRRRRSRIDWCFRASPRSSTTAAPARPPRRRRRACRR